MVTTGTTATKFFTVGNNVNLGDQVGFDCLCTMATKLFTLGNYGNYDNQLVYFSAKTTERLFWF
jgi:hypothetical protein